MVPDVHNVIGGRAQGPTVQAGAVHGDVHFHQARTAQLPVPRQLLVAPRNFVDRHAEVGELDRVLAADDGCQLVLITGVGGVGKSALAMHWSHRASPHFPEGQLYANLGALNPDGPRTPADALGRFLRSLGIAPERVPTDTDEQAALFRSITADKRILVLLDNAVSATQVRPLLPTSPGSVVIVTARWRLGGLIADGAQFIQVSPLEEAAATDLLRRIVGEQRVAGAASSVSSLARLCGGLPLALLITGARLASRPRLSLERITNELGQEHRRLAALSTHDHLEDVSVTATLDGTFADLATAAARCYCVVGLHPGPEFCAPPIAAALNIAQDEAEGLLETLVEASLLDHVSDARYRMHDLVRLHAKQRGEQDTKRDEVLRRFVEWYLAGTRAADLALTRYRRRPPDSYLFLDPDIVDLHNRDEALTWLDDERHNLVATIEAAAQALPALAWQLADAMWALFLYRRHHQDRLRVDTVALACAQRLGDAHFEGRSLRRLGWAHFDMGRLQDSHDLFSQSRAIFEELGDQYELAGAIGALGAVTLAQQQYEAAAGHLTEAIGIYVALGESRNLALTLIILGQVFNRSGQQSKATDCFTQARAAFDVLGDVDPYNAARCDIELGSALRESGELERSAEVLEQALREMTRLGSPRGRAQALQALGELSLSLGNDTDAAARLTLAAEIFDELADSEAVAARQQADRIRRANPQPMPATTDP